MINWPWDLGQFKEVAVVLSPLAPVSLCSLRVVGWFNRKEEERKEKINDKKAQPIGVISGWDPWTSRGVSFCDLFGVLWNSN
jgi:hypothetical protein